MKRLVHAIFYNDPDGYPPIINSSRLLAQAGYDLRISCRHALEKRTVSYPSSVHIHRVQSRSSASWREYFGFVLHVLRYNPKVPDFFVAHDMHALLPARLLATRFRRPLIYHCHDFTDASRVLPLGSQLVRAFERRFARTAELVIVPDAERAHVVVHQLGLRREPLIVANAPIARPTSSEPELQPILSKQGMHFDQILIRQGRIGVGHAIEATLHSIPYWPNEDWGFVLLGPGDPPYIAGLLALAQSLGVERQFAVLPPVAYDQVSQFTLGADAGHGLYEPIHINNVHITTASNKLLEYMAAGLPLLVSNRPALARFVAKYGCGLTADENDPLSIAQAVSRLLGEPRDTQRMGNAAAKAFEDEFNFERQFAPVLQAIDLLAKRHRA